MECIEQLEQGSAERQAYAAGWLLHLGALHSQWVAIVPASPVLISV